MGNFQELYNLLSPFVNDFMTFIQATAILVAGGMAIYYKVREMAGNPQEDQMYSQKTTKVLVGLVVIFLIPTIIKIAEAYFKK